MTPACSMRRSPTCRLVSLNVPEASTATYALNPLPAAVIAGKAAQTSSEMPAKISFLRPVASMAAATFGSSTATDSRKPDEIQTRKRNGAFRLGGGRRRALGVGVAHTDDRRALHPQHRVGIERRVPVRYPDRDDAHDFLPLVSCMLRCGVHRLSHAFSQPAAKGGTPWRFARRATSAFTTRRPAP